MKKIEVALNEALNELQSIDSAPYTKQGFVEFKVQISKYIIRLYEESFRNSKKNSSDVITNSHVIDASNYLTKINKFRLANILNTLGGVCIGSTITFIVSIFSFNFEYKPEVVIFQIVLGIIGGLILGFTLSKE